MDCEHSHAARDVWFADERQFSELQSHPAFAAGLLAHAHDGLSIADQGGKCILVNRVMCQMTGFSADELLTATPYPYWPAEELDAIRGVLGRIEDAPSAELSLLRKSGKRFPVLFRPVLIRDVYGETLVSLSSIVDLSATRALEASEQRWRSIAENPFDFVIILDRHYKYRFINQVLPGVDPKQMIAGASPFDYLAPEDHERVRRHFDETFKTGRPTSYEVYVPGYDRWYSNVVGAIKSDGEIRELSLLSRDITESKRSERMQRRSERRLALALASVQDGLVELDLQSGAHIYSARAYELLGYADGDPELSTRMDGLLSRVHPEEVELVERDLLAATSGAISFDREFRIRTRDASYRWFHVRGRSLEDEKCFIAFLTDVTQRYEVEEQRRVMAAELQQAQRLETIGTLAGGIAHDFNNLLTPIVGALELAQMALPSGSGAHAMLDDARGAAHRAKCLTEQILTFARRGQPRLDPVDLVQLVREELRLQPTPASVQVLTDFPADIPIVLGERAQIQQIVANLLANALHAMRGRSGQLRLRVDCSSFEASESDDYVRLTLSDQGVGMPESVQRRVFEPFFTTKPLGEGTGLGLAVVHGVVKRHRGHLRMHSEPDKGTTFEVYLPLAKNLSLRTSERPPTPVAAALSGEILCVDDEPAVLSLMKRALEMASYSVRTTTAPHEALEWISSAAPSVDVLVTDYRMPGLSGLELAQRAGVIKPGLSVIMVTGHAEGLPTTGNPPGVHALIRKPFHLSELLQCVQRCLSASQAQWTRTAHH
ncbi:MAG TPA: PAS domain S-box protein [Polyangiales bacterium]|nr:PAS domain S-box protein [Polyangiales bacterium]